jgi:uncharacterized membrane protein YagU involved in acid resistance
MTAYSNWGPQLAAVACPSGSQCTAVDWAGHEVTFNPRSSKPSRSATIDGPREGVWRRVCGFTGGQCATIYSTQVAAVACPSLEQCTAVDTSGREVTFNPAAPGNPTLTRIDSSSDGGNLDGIACPSTSQCTAVDTDGREVTFNPRSPERSTSTTIDGPAEALAMSSVACPSLNQCTAVDGNGREVTFNPRSPDAAAWRPPPTPRTR